MKRLVVILFAVVLILLSGCGKQSAISGKTVEDCTYYVEDRCYLTLPYSETPLRIWDADVADLEKVDLGLLWDAEKKILKEIPESEKEPSFSISKDEEGFLCLRAEVIVELEPPTKDGLTLGGCGNDHDHLFFTERITK